MKKKTIVRSIIILIVFIFITIITDYTLSIFNKEPLFACAISHSDIQKDGGSKTCNGIGYKVKVEKEITAIDGEKTDVKFSFNFN